MQISKYRLKRLANIAYGVFTLVFWLCIILIAVFVTAFLFCTIMPNEKFIITESTENNLLRFNDKYSYEFDPSLYDGLNTRIIFQYTFSFMIFISLMLSLMMYQIKCIIGTVRSEDPFYKKNSQRLNLLGILAILSSFLFGLFEYIIAKTSIELFALENIRVNYRPDLGFLLLGLFFIVLAGVFHYGNFLQEEYDGVV